MKKLLLQILFVMLLLPAMSQNFFTVIGTVTDTGTGNPIPNQAVYISSDSATGWFYYKTVYTNNSGFYADSVPVPPNIQCVLYVSTYDCQNYRHQVTLTLAPPATTFTVDFAICYFNNPCQANFTTQQQQSLTVQFMDASTGGGSTRLWMFGDGANSSELNPIHTYGMPGYYNVTLSIGALGTTCYQVTTQTVYVWDSTGGGCHAAFFAIPDSMNTLNTYHFINQSSGNIASYTWNFGDGLSQVVIVPGNPNVVHTYSQPGIYMVCLKIQGVDSSCFDITCDTLVVGTTPGCHAYYTYYTDSLTSAPNVHFIDQSLGNLVSWSWSFGDPASGTSNISTLRNPSHVFSSPGSYDVCLTVHGADSTCYDTHCNTVVAGGGPGCQAYFTYTCPAVGNYTVDFTDLSEGNPTSWFWSFGDGTSSTIQNPVHVFGSTGIYNVCLTITGNNCTSVFCKNVSVIDSMNFHQVFGQVFAGNVPLSNGLAMIFSFDTSPNYQPFVGVSPIDSAGMYFFNMVPNGNYYILALPFDSNGYLPTYYGNTITWEQATMITLGTENNPYNINLVPSDQMTPGPGSTAGQINLSKLKSSLVDKVNMILKNSQGQPIGFTKVSTSGAFTFPSMAYGTYYLHPEMPGVTSDEVMIVLTPSKPHADVVMTFNGKKIMGIRDELSLVNHWSVYPNPVIDHLDLHIDLKQATTAAIDLYNVTGERVSGSEIRLNEGTNTTRISTASLPAGIYTLRLLSGEGLILTTKLIITR